MSSARIPASYFGMILGLAGMGQAWRAATVLWGLPRVIGEGVLLLATLIWAALLITYLYQALRHPQAALAEAMHPVQGGTPALMCIATMLVAMAILPYSRTATECLAAVALTAHLLFSLWHTGTVWRGGRNHLDTVPTVYLPTVAGNFTSAAVLGGLGLASWGWLFLGAGVFSWLALESLMIQRMLGPEPLPVPQRPLIGIQFAPPVVCGMACLMLSPGAHEPWLLMLWGYGLFQLLLGMRMRLWLGEQPFAMSYWSYTFGIAATTICSLKLAISGVASARILSLPIFGCANAFIGYLTLKTFALVLNGRFVIKPAV
ncbi:dicarboxylate transporter/tellurite-resistance protein TehA [Chitinivorax sp. PXF-14]|uniref:dicarboxylate transporter/tellurite-resistance protein TehA n=1 Tax=Chitinivorax sp. PXF-14 TaxID=3230488 RepID=UPI003466C85D